MNQPKDELLQLYREASALDPRRPSKHVREAVRAHAHRLAASGHQDAQQPVAAPGPAANQPRWKVSMLASVLLAALAGLLLLQFDQGTPQEKDLVRGQPAPIPGPAVAPATQAAVVPPATEAAAVAVSPGDLADDKAGSVAKSGSLSRPAPLPGAQGKATPARTLPSPVAPPAQPAGPAAFTVDGQDRADASAPTPASAAAAVRQQGRAEAPPVAAAAPVAEAPAPEPSIAGDDAREARRKALREALRPGRSSMAPMAPAEGAAHEAPTQRAAPLQRLAPAGPLAPALRDAAYSGRLQELERLITLGAPVDAADTAGRTPLMLAVMSGHASAVRRLLDAGADRALVDHDGRSALLHARQRGLDRIAAMIEAAP